MKIHICCNWKLKFAGLLIDAWERQGHEVRYEMGYNPEAHEWADVCFVDVCDNNAKVASQNRFPNSKLAVRGIDIECWQGQCSGVNWENVDVAIFGAKHILEYMRGVVEFPDTTQVVHIPFGVNLDKWTFAEREAGPNIAFVAHRWEAKSVPVALQVMAELGKDYQIHFLGTKSREPWYHSYLDYMVEKLGINATFQEHVDDMDAWLEPMNFVMTSSMKETFSYAIAEGMAKGIKPLTHNFYGAEDIWPAKWIWNTVRECAAMVKDYPYNSHVYRDYIQRNYTDERMIQEINKVCGIAP